MEPKTKILIVAESPALPTGSAEMVRSIFEGLTKEHPEAYELTQICLADSFAVTYPKWPVHSITMAKEKNGDFQCVHARWPVEETLRNIVLGFRPDIIFALNDPAGLAPLSYDVANRPYKLLLYLKINGLPIPLQSCPILNRADLIVTMSEWARRGLLTSCPSIPVDKVEVMYSPADTARFVPLLGSERQEARRALLPDWMPQDAFVIGWVGRPRWRKQVWLLYKVIHYLRTGKYLLCSDCGRVSLCDWDPLTRCHLNQGDAVLESRPGYKFDVCAKCQSGNVHPADPLQDVFLWFHMPKDDPLSDWPISWLEHQYGVEENKDIYYTKGYGARAALAPDDVPTLYQLWDCLLYLSGAGSFGLPAWEAMCSALPVVYTDYSSHAEFLGAGKAGLAVDGVLQPEGKTGLWRSIADVSQAVAAVRRLYYDRDLGRELASNGHAFVQKYNQETQARKWHQIFRRLLQQTSSLRQSLGPCTEATLSDRTCCVVDADKGV